MIGTMAVGLDLVDRLIRAIEAGDLDGVRACYSPDVTVRANFDQRDRDLESSMRVLSWLVENTSSRRYEVLRRIEIEGGVLQQHVLHGTVASTGKDYAMPACLVITIAGAAITHVDEYLDPAVMTSAFAAD
jgi:ketosteroid isomerase-like protein